MQLARPFLEKFEEKKSRKKKQKEYNQKRKEKRKLERDWTEALKENRTFDRIREHEKIAMPAEDMDIGKIRASAALKGLAGVELRADGHWYSVAPTGIPFIAYFIMDSIKGLVTIMWTRADTILRFTPNRFRDTYLTDRFVVMF
jgi:hypothetical protein